MGPGAVVEINQEILRACLDGFAKRGFSGDIVYRYEWRQILRSVVEVHVVPVPLAPEANLESVAKVWARVAQWVAHADQTLMTVRFQHGKVTRVDIRDPKPRWDLNPAA